MIRAPLLSRLMLVGLLALPARASAADERDRHAIFERAQMHLRKEHWELARALLEQLWNERRTHDVALQLGQAEYHLGRYRLAAEHLAYGIALLPPREKLQTAQRARHLLDLCRKQVGALALQIENRGAEVTVDGRSVGTAPLPTELFVDPGPHVVEVHHAGHRSVNWSLQLAAGEVQTRRIRLEPLETSNRKGSGAETTGPRTSKPTAPGSSPQPPGRASYAPVVAGGILAVAGISTGIAMHLMRNARAAEADRLRQRVGPYGCQYPPSVDPAQCERLIDLSADYDSFGRIELLSFLLGGGALLATGTYFMLARPDQSDRSVELRARPFRLEGSHSARQTRIDLTLQF